MELVPVDTRPGRSRPELQSALCTRVRATKKLLLTSKVNAQDVVL